MKRLNAKRSKFVSEYCKDLNATQAAKRAGYSKATAGSIGHDLLKIPEIKTAIDEKLGRVCEKVDVTVEWIVKELVALHSKAKQESVKLGTLEFLGKWQGMLKDKGDAPQIVFVGADDFDKDPGAGVSGAE